MTPHVVSSKDFWGKFFIIWMWMFHFFGVIGIYFWDRIFFLSSSWISLIVAAFAMIFNLSSPFKKESIGIVAAISFGFFLEVLGVHSKLIFGEYTYGENLGVKLWGVPLMIGVNWFILSYASAAVVNKLGVSLWLKVLLASVLMVGIDFLIEPIAPKFDFWSFESGKADWHNYLGWLLASLLLQWILQKNRFAKVKFSTAIQVLTAFTLFFIACNLLES